MDVLRWLASIRIPILDDFFLLITSLGEETAFLVVALVLFWCVDKKQGYYVLSIGFIGTIINQFLKLVFHISRPWILDPEFKPVPEAMPEATGFSFPSGHTQNSVTTFGGIAATRKQKWVKITCIAACVLVPFSRMYLGVHTPQDVLVSVVIALVLIFAVRPIFTKCGDKGFVWLMGGMLALALGYLLYVHLYPFPAEVQGDNLQHGIENAYTLLGALLGLLVVWFVDGKWLNFSVKAPWWGQIAKVAIGLLAVLAVKAGLKAPLNALFGDFAGRAIRYFLIVIVAGIVWPLSFRLFSKKEKV